MQTDELGPAMAELNERQREFVRKWVALGYQGEVDATEAAREAGYAKGSYGALRVAGHRLSHDPKVQAAILEVCRKEAVLAAAAVALPATISIALNKDFSPKDRLRACEMLFNRGGMPAMSEQKITVEHRADGSQLKAFAAQLALELGVSREKLLGWDGVTIEAKAEEVSRETVGDDG